MQEEKKTPDIKKSSTANSGLKPIQDRAPQKKKKKMSASALICIVLVVAVAGVLAAVYFDLGGAKQIAASLLKIETVQPQEEDTESERKKAELEKREETLKSMEADLKLKEDELKEKEGGLNSKEAELSNRETALAEAEKEADKQREAYLKTVAERIGKMDVKKAAAAISGMDTSRDMAKILLYIAPEQAALIMNQMKSALATEILSEMMK